MFQTPSRCPAEPPVKQGSVDDGALSTIMTEAMVDSHSAEEAIHEKVGTCCHCQLEKS